MRISDWSSDVCSSDLSTMSGDRWNPCWIDPGHARPGNRWSLDAHGGMKDEQPQVAAGGPMKPQQPTPGFAPNPTERKRWPDPPHDDDALVDLESEIGRAHV